MDAAKLRKSNNLNAKSHVVSSESGSDSFVPVHLLSEEIDRLRSVMTETFLQESSFTADSVIHVSRQLDLKINEYMAHMRLRKQAR